MMVLIIPVVFLTGCPGHRPATWINLPGSCQDSYRLSRQLPEGEHIQQYFFQKIKKLISIRDALPEMPDGTPT
jgi:hypothetical protein